MPKKVLIIATSCCTFPESAGGAPTGCWAEEVAAPYYALKEAGVEVTIASINGGEIPMDEASLAAPAATKVVEKFLLDDEAMAQVTGSKALKDVKAADYDAVFLPGGHGTAFDFHTSEELAKQLSEAWAAGKVLAAVCHGPTGLVNVKDTNGELVIKGRKVTGFSDEEERAVHKDDLIPWLLEAKLKELGGEYTSVPAWQPHAVVDGRLITGQNPSSSEKVGQLLVEALK